MSAAALIPLAGPKGVRLQWLGPFTPTVRLVVATPNGTRRTSGRGSGQPRMGARLDASDWLRCSVSSHGRKPCTSPAYFE